MTVRREHAYGVDWIKTANAGGYFGVGDDPARATCSRIESTLRSAPKCPLEHRSRLSRSRSGDN